MGWVRFEDASKKRARASCPRRLCMRALAKRVWKCAWLGGVAQGAIVQGRYGVTLTSTSGDFAEWHEQLDPREVLSEGDVVGFHDGKISLSTTSASTAITTRSLLI